MVINGYGRIRLVCGNHGDDVSHEMYVKEVKRPAFYEGRRREALPSAPFYACPEYTSLLAHDTSGRRSCNNRLSVTDRQKLLDAIELAEEEGSVFSSIIGRKFQIGATECVVLNDDNGIYTVRVLNRRAVNS